MFPEKASGREIITSRGFWSQLPEFGNVSVKGIQSNISAHVVPENLLMFLLCSIPPIVSKGVISQLVE